MSTIGDLPHELFPADFIFSNHLSYVSHPILGADVLWNFCIPVDLCHRRLRTHSNNNPTGAFFTAPVVSHRHVITAEAVTNPKSARKPYYGFPADFATLSKPLVYHQHVLKGVVHRIRTQGPPVHVKTQHLVLSKEKKNTNPELKPCEYLPLSLRCSLGLHEYTLDKGLNCSNKTSEDKVAMIVTAAEGEVCQYNY